LLIRSDRTQPLDPEIVAGRRNLAIQPSASKDGRSAQKKRRSAKLRRFDYR
jgi:hypothetical protein